MTKKELRASRSTKANADKETYVKPKTINTLNPTLSISNEAKAKGIGYWDFMKETSPQFVHEVSYQRGLRRKTTIIEQSQVDSNVAEGV